MGQIPTAGSPDLNNTPNHAYWVYQDGRLVENHILYNSYGVMKYSYVFPGKC